MQGVAAPPLDPEDHEKQFEVCLRIWIVLKESRLQTVISSMGVVHRILLKVSCWNKREVDEVEEG